MPIFEDAPAVDLENELKIVMAKDTDNKISAATRLGQRSLSKLKPDVAVPTYDRGSVGVGIVHFGPGAFHRGHQACYIDTLLAGDPRWGICAAELKGRGQADVLREQDFLYTVAELELQPRYRIVGSMKEYLAAESDAGSIFARLVDPAVKLVTCTVTEKGYCLDGAGGVDLKNADIAHDLANPHAPSSLVGWIAEGLRRRRAAGLKPFIAMSCDNVAGNGHKLRKAVIGLVEAAGEKDLAAWIADSVRFPCTMVDSITPAANDELKRSVAAATGLYDEAPVHREKFQQWVVEDILGADGPDLARVGADMTRDVEAYEHAKLRLLNGAHSTLTYIGLLKGCVSVDKAMAEADLARFVEEMMRQDVVATLRPVAGFDFSDYISAILQRFRNPALTHLLYQIASDGTQKLPYRILDVIADALAAGRPIVRLAVPVAAWMRFVRREANEGRKFADPMSDTLIEIGKSCTGQAAADLPRFFALETVFKPALVKDPRFVSEVAKAYDRIGGGTYFPA